MSIIAYKAELLVIDFEGTSKEDVEQTLKNSSLYPSVLSLVAREMPREEWTDDHFLNKTDKSLEQVRDFFKLPEDGRVYVDRPLRPDTELESENKLLKIENERLKAALRLINAESGRVLGK